MTSPALSPSRMVEDVVSWLVDCIASILAPPVVEGPDTSDGAVGELGTTKTVVKLVIFDVVGSFVMVLSMVGVLVRSGLVVAKLVINGKGPNKLARLVDAAGKAFVPIVSSEYHIRLGNGDIVCV